MVCVFDVYAEFLDGPRWEFRLQWFSDDLVSRRRGTVLPDGSALHPGTQPPLAYVLPRDRYMRRAIASNSGSAIRERQLGRDLYDDALPLGCAAARRACGRLAPK